MQQKFPSESVLTLKEKLLKLRAKLNKVEEKQGELFERCEISQLDGKRRASSAVPRRNNDKQNSLLEEKLSLEFANTELKKKKATLQEQYNLLLEDYNKQAKRIEELSRENQQLKKENKRNLHNVIALSSTSKGITFSTNLPQVYYIDKTDELCSYEQPETSKPENYEKKANDFNYRKGNYRKYFMFRPAHDSLNEQLTRLKNIIKYKSQ